MDGDLSPPALAPGLIESYRRIMSRSGGASGGVGGGGRAARPRGRQWSSCESQAVAKYICKKLITGKYTAGEVH